MLPSQSTLSRLQFLTCQEQAIFFLFIPCWLCCIVYTMGTAGARCPDTPRCMAWLAGVGCVHRGHILNTRFSFLRVYYRLLLQHKSILGSYIQIRTLPGLGFYVVNDGFLADMIFCHKPKHTGMLIVFLLAGTRFFFTNDFKFSLASLAIQPTWPNGIEGVAANWWGHTSALPLC